MPHCGRSLRSAATAYDAPLRYSFDAYFGRIIGSHASSFARTMSRSERRTDTMDIGGWLRRLGLQRYEQAFRENEIDLRVLPELTADDLKELGVAAIGHRRLLLKAITDLAAGAGCAAEEDVSPASAPAEAERRQLTVMFCDLVGSTPLSTRGKSHISSRSCRASRVTRSSNPPSRSAAASAAPCAWIAAGSIPAR